MANSGRNMANEDPYNDEIIRPEPVQEGSLPPIPHDAEETTADEEVDLDESRESEDQDNSDLDHDDDPSPREE